MAKELEKQRQLEKAKEDEELLKRQKRGSSTATEDAKEIHNNDSFENDLGEETIHLVKFVYTITWLLCAFSLAADRDLLKDTHRWRQIHVRSRQRTCFSFFMPRKSFNKPFEFLLYKTNRVRFPVCVYCKRSQKTPQRVKNNSHITRLRLVSYFFVLYIIV